MSVKLNLSISEAAAKSIKEYAARNNTSVSKIAEQLFNKLTAKPERKGKSFVELYAGTLSHHIPDINRAKDEYLKKKYGS
jgi:16S rRNA G966 N2-methylase RsmD